jgi:hypothetical protein
VIASAALSARSFLHAKFGGSSFLPKMDSGTSRSTCARRPRRVGRLCAPEDGKGGPLARTMQGNQGNQQLDQRRAAAASMSTSASAASASAAPPSRGRAAREDARLVGAEYVVLDDLNNGGGKPVQIEFTGPDSRKLMD